MAGSGAAKRPQARTWIPLVIGMIVCVATHLYLQLFQADMLAHTSFWSVTGILGQFLTRATFGAVIAIIVWAVVWFGFVARTGRNVMDRYFLILMGVSLMAGLFLVSLSTAEQFMTAVRTQSAMQQAAVDRQRFANDATAFEKDLRDTMGQGVLQPGSGPADIPAERAKVAKARALLATHRARQAARLDAERAAVIQTVTQSGHPDRVRQFDTMRAARAQPANDFWAAYDAQLTEVDGMLADLSRARGWRSTSGGPRFQNPVDAKAYAQHGWALSLINANLAEARSALMSPYAPSYRRRSDANLPPSRPSE